MTFNGREVPDMKGKYDASSNEMGAKTEAGMMGNEMIFGDTDADLADMQRLGKKQEFKRIFGLISTLGFISIYMATWEFVLVSLSAGITNGGYGGLFWGFIGTVICYGTIVASLAEIESMAPTSGVQYHWVSEFAPAKYQRILSYSAGWMSTLGWLVSVSSSVFVMTSLIEAIIDVKDTTFTFTNWQYTLIMLAFLLVTIACNTWGALTLPKLETLSLVGHLGGLLVVMIPRLVMCPKNSARDVFLEVTNSAGWNSTGLSCLIAQSSVLYCNLGSDSAVHISEEVEDASLNVPRAIWWSYLMNVVMGIAMLITMLFCLGPLEGVVGNATPYLILFQNTGSNATNYKRNVPDNAVYLTSVFAGILCLINLGSTFAFNIIVSQLSSLSSPPI